jgi:2,5-diamino-6-(ribosylamino)-4(3H)-pyrimidinone 5'-phosphate reductase
MEKPITTLFMLISVDGKISTGAIDDRDTDKDYKRIAGIKEGVGQYYDLEKQTDRFSLNTGKVMAKIGVNTDKNPIHCPDVTFVIIDDSFLTREGVENLCSNLKELILVTHNAVHPAFGVERENLKIIKYEGEIDFVDLFQKLKKEHGVDRLTIQSGGTLNAVLLRKGLIDKLSVVVTPCLIGGKDTPTLIDGVSLVSEEDLKYIKILKLEKADVLENSFLHLQYSVNSNTEVSI